MHGAGGGGWVPLRTPRLAALQGKPAMTGHRRQFWKVLSICPVHPPILRGLQGPAPRGKSGEGGGPWEGGREGLASSGGQWGLPVGAQGPRTHRRKCGPARPLPAPPPTPSHPPPCRPPEGKAAAGRAVLTGGDCAPGSECTQSPNSPGGEDATPDTDGRRGARGSPPRPGGSWVWEPGSAQVRTVEQSPRDQRSSAPRLRRSPPRAPDFPK